MPTKHPRIPVTKDAALAEALAAVAPYFRGKRTATIVHDLALRGAKAITDDREAEDDAIERLIAASTQRDGSLDWDVVESIDAAAWGE